MRITRVLAPLVAAASLLVAGAQTSSAADATLVPETGFATPEQEKRLQEELAQSKPVIATYKGRKINLSDGWQGAQACSELQDGSVQCYATTQEADQAAAKLAATQQGSSASRSLAKEATIFGPTAATDCAYGWVCFWEHSDYTGRRLQWSAKGTKNFGDWGFRDQASAACVKRDMQGVLAYDARTLQMDPFMALGNLGCYKFPNASYPGGGTWNDKVDYIEM
ncbi:peptidase inhibitor family I36 protein [Streptomyces filamentosus]|uniref:Peptidase inhibitor family I36 n=1 Tax=Streptomyces filamentosus TaxID=67294 RepID=A0A919BJJ0_STRFL|nr:peptidase inhibitor family I36 protein [Streptomyces filamentosus]GHF91983.1 hypothetical protein GCM10017667_21830 [Streptomyces filamentosus]